MNSEIKSFLKVWILAITCLCYCYHVAGRIPRGKLRLFSFLPILYLFIILPLDLTSVHLAAPTTFFLLWLASFRLLLFSFDQGPLSPPPPNVFHFISLACLPIKLKQDPSPQNNNETPHEGSRTSIQFLPRSVLLSIKTVLLAISLHSLSYRQFMHPSAVLTLYCVLLYLELEVVLALCALPVRFLFGFDLEPQFNEPYLATSLQDFWGRRWNLMVTKILRPTVYDPVHQSSRRRIGPRWAPMPAVFATFVVSGVMHEIIFLYLTRVRPTGEVTCFFILHGICVPMEVAAKKVIRGRWELHRVVSGALTVGFVGLTGLWLFFPQITRNGVDEKAFSEYSVFFNFVKEKLRCCLSVLQARDVEL